METNGWNEGIEQDFSDVPANVKRIAYVKDGGAAYWKPVSATKTEAGIRKDWKRQTGAPLNTVAFYQRGISEITGEFIHGYDPAGWVSK